MSQSADDASMSRIGVAVPNNHKEALFLLAKYKSAEQRDNVTLSDLVRKSITDYFDNHEDLPEEVRDLLDEEIAMDPARTPGESLNQDDVREANQDDVEDHLENVDETEGSV